MERVKLSELGTTGIAGDAIRPGPLWFPMLLVLFALLLASSTVRAHGGSGYYQIVGEPMGDYTIHVWTSPGLLRTGEVHVDTAVFDARGVPAFDTLIMVKMTPMEKAETGEFEPMTAMAGSPYELYPHTREAQFVVDAPGDYRLEVILSDAAGMVGTTSLDVRVQTITDSIKFLIFVLGLLSVACGLWLVLHTRHFWTPQARRASRSIYRKEIKDRSTGPRIVKLSKGEFSYMAAKSMSAASRSAGTVKAAGRSEAGRVDTGHRRTVPRTRRWYALLNGPYHARALWIFMLIVVAHWLEHVLQIYQIYGLGWAPSASGGLIGVFFPVLITSETLHFFYDFIQWAGIVVLGGGFSGRARKFWLIAMVVQTWHFIEHVLLMGQYLTGYYIFGRVKQTSILELFFPREELHFMYNLIVFVPMVIAVHYYLRLKDHADK